MATTRSTRLTVAAIAAVALVALLVWLVPRSPQPAPTSTAGSATPRASLPGTGGPSIAPSAGADGSPAVAPTDGGPSPTAEGQLPVAPVTWTPLTTDGDSPGPRAGHTWTVDPSSGVAYLVGGAAEAGPLGDVWAYDLGADAWRQLDPGDDGPGAITGHAAAWLDELGVVIFGGLDGAGVPSNALWAFDPSRAEWRRLEVPGPAPAPRAATCMATADDGRLWVTGGLGAGEEPLADTWVFDPAATTWTEVEAADPPEARSGHGCWWSRDGELLLFGGRTAAGPTGERWALEGAAANSPRWSPVARSGALPARADFALERYNDLVVVAGGVDARGAPATDVVAFEADGREPVRYVASDRGPGGLVSPALVGDPAGERLLLYGGSAGGTPRADLWQLVLD